jgi:hypothetical protein
VYQKEKSISQKHSSRERTNILGTQKPIFIFFVKKLSLRLLPPETLNRNEEKPSTLVTFTIN